MANQNQIRKEPDNKIPVPAQQVQAEHGYPSAPIAHGKGSRIPMWSWAVLATFLLLGCVVFAIFASGLVISERTNRVFSVIGIEIGKLEEQTPLLTASQFYQALIDHDYDTAHPLLAPDLAAIYTPTALRSRWQVLEEASDDMRLELDLYSSKPEGSKISVKLSLVPTRGDHYDINLRLERFDDSWRIVDATPGLIPEP